MISFLYCYLVYPSVLLFCPIPQKYQYQNHNLFSPVQYRKRKLSCTCERTFWQPLYRQLIIFASSTVFWQGSCLKHVISSKLNNRPLPVVSFTHQCEPHWNYSWLEEHSIQVISLCSNLTRNTVKVVLKSPLIYSKRPNMFLHIHYLVKRCCKESGSAELKFVKIQTTSRITLYEIWKYFLPLITVGTIHKK